MNKKLIISKTITFILIVAFIIIFKSVFGDENTLIGVTTITAALMFLERDLTLSPIKNSLNLILLNLFIGLASIVASNNMILGIPVNFLVLFTISYLFCYNLKKPMYLPFSLQYLFLLSTPVSNEQIIMRLSSLVFGAIFIMAIQMLANKDRINKSGNKILLNICDSIINKINLVKTDQKRENISVKGSIDAFRKMVYDKREADFYLTEEARIKLNLSVALESIDSFLDGIKDINEYEEILIKLEAIISEVKHILENGQKDTELLNDVKKLMNDYKDKNVSDILTLQMLESIIFICDATLELNNLSKENYNTVKKVGKIPEAFKDGVLKTVLSNTKSLKVSYSIRVSMSITIAIFISDYFKLSEGRWIAFTVFSLVNPIYEVSQTKTKDRIVATIIGSIIVMILFSIFEDITIRSLILMSAGYIGSYTTEYKYNMICVTVSAIGAAAILGNTEVLILNRIIFVIIGAIISMIANKFILPYRLEDSNKQLDNLYKKVIQQMIKEVYKAAGGLKETHKIKNLIIKVSLIEERFRLNNQILEHEIDKNILDERRFLVSQIYELYIWIVREKIDIKDIKYIIEDIKNLIAYNEGEENIKLEDIENHIKETDDLKTKITLSSILIIFDEFRKIDRLKAQS